MDFGPLDISTASSWTLATTTAWKELGVENLAKADRFSFQLARLFVSVDAGTPGTSFTLTLLLATKDRATVYGVTTATCTISSARQTGGTAGNYLCTISINGREVADMLGAMDNKSEAGALAWFVGVPDGFPVGAAHVYVRGALTPIV